MPDWGWPRLLAHRCGGALAPENTLAGLGIAAALGCAAVEFDVMLSADDEPLLIHDESLYRTAGIPGEVASLPGAALRAVDVGRPFHAAFAAEMIPSLDAALDRCCALGLAANLEIKPAAGHEARTGQVVGDLLAARARLPALLLSSFSSVALVAAASRVPALPRGWLVDACGAEAIRTARALGCASLHVSHCGLTSGQVAAIRAAGLCCMVYTVNDPAEAARLLAMDVYGIFSDRPDLLLPVLAAQNLR